MFNIVGLIKTAGYLGLFAIVFAESGLFIGFFLPGDSLLFTAGFLASQGYLRIWILIPVIFIGAVLGDNVGYAFGRKVGPMIFVKEDSLFFHKSYLDRAQVFYERYGKKAIVLARFMPGVRTFAPILAGVGKMQYADFLFYNIIGGIVWGMGLPLLGYYLGNTVPNIQEYLNWIIGAIILLSVAPTTVHILRNAEHRALIIQKIKKIF